jgi:hypothetical protein
MSAQALYWIAIIVGLAGIVIYFIALAMRPRIVRMVHGSGLFFSGLGLVQLAILVRTTAPALAWFNANIAIVCLIIAIAVQSYAVLSNRRAWDGVDRRRGADSAIGNA